jgi:endo-1,4-beta-mannosidase
MRGPWGRAGHGEAMSAFDGRFLLGVNYWSRGGGPRMWERFDEARVAAELGQMRAIGLDACRLFAYVPSFVPSPPRVEPEMLARFRRVAQLAGEAGVGILPSALVGHMSGENYDFPGQRGRSLYADPELLSWQAALVGELAGALADCPSVLGFVLSNEMPLWAGAGAPDQIEAWCARLVAAIRARSPLPVGTGDGAMAGFPTRRLAPQLDWLAPHVYYGDTDPLRQAFQIDLSLAQLRALGRPLLLEEFGCSSTQAGEREQAAYFREAIATAFASGARGAIAWCFSDFDVDTLGREPPYSHHGFELGFGVTRADGSEKPVCDELRAWRRFLDALPSGALAPPRPVVALVKPRYLEEDFPFSWQDREAMRRTLLQAYVLASQAGLDPIVVGEEDDLGPYRLILVPATQKLTTPTWLALQERARAGATVYWSYFSGDHTFHQAPWCPNFRALTGLDHRLRYGCFDLPPERFTLKGALALSIPTGVEAAIAPQSLSRVPIELAGAQALAFDGDGRPALTVNAIGSGRVIFCAWPLERYLANLTDGSSREGHRLYRLLAEHAGVVAHWATRHPEVQARSLKAPGTDLELVVVQNRGWTEPVDDAVDVPRDAEVLLDRGNPSSRTLGQKGLRIYGVKSQT